MTTPTMTGFTPGSPPQFGDGNIRIWTKDGDEARSANSIHLGGNLVMNDMSYTAQQLGFTDTERTITLYVEGHSLGSNVIIVSMDYVDNGQTVRVTDTVKYEVQESHWVVTRNKAATTAIAEAGQGDTILNLAVDIGLKPDEFKEWLTFTGQKERSQYCPRSLQDEAIF